MNWPRDASSRRVVVELQRAVTASIQPVRGPSGELRIRLNMPPARRRWQRLRESTRMEATAKPAGRACPWCDDAGWRWNGFEWYAADADTRKLHVCTTAEAVADRSEREARATHGGLRRAFAKLLR